MVNVFHRKIQWFRRFKSGDFDVADKEYGKSPYKFEDVELQAPLNEDTQKQLAEQLGVNQRAVFNRLRAMGKIQKSGRWVPRELNDKQMENVTFCSQGTKRNRIRIVSYNLPY